jgi:hypothetical protein
MVQITGGHKPSTEGRLSGISADLIRETRNSAVNDFVPDSGPELPVARRIALQILNLFPPDPEIDSRNGMVTRSGSSVGVGSPDPE